MAKDGIPAITISLRDLPRRLVITTDEAGAILVSEGSGGAEAEGAVDTMLKGLAHTRVIDAAIDGGTDKDAGTGRTIVTVTRSDPKDGGAVEVRLDKCWLDFPASNSIPVPLAPGRHTIYARMRGLPGQTGWAALNGQKIGLVIDPGASTDDSPKLPFTIA